MYVLTHAVINRNAEIVRLLIDAGAKNFKNQSTYDEKRCGWTPLMYAAEIGDFEIVMMVLAADEYEFRMGGNRNINVCDRNYQTALQIAIKNKHVQVAELLVKTHADALVSDQDGICALDFAVRYGFKNLINLIRDFSKQIGDDDRLYQAIAHDDVEIAELLLMNNANPNCRNHRMDTPFLFAMKKPRPDIDMMRLLLRAGANPNECNEDGYTPMQLATKARNEELVDLLIRYGGEY